MSEGRMTFREHLVELRVRLLRAAIAVFICALFSFAFAEQLYVLLSLPMKHALPAGSSFIVTGPIEYFLVVLKLSATAGLFIASPWVLYQFWLFVAPGLYSHERTYAGAFVFFGSLFFSGGAAFAYFVVFPVGLPFLIGMNPPDVLGMYKVGEYYSFAVRMLLAFGVAFELPVVVVLLSLLGVVDPKTLASYRRYAMVGSFVFAAVLTPPDVVSQVSMALPLYLLFEGGVLVARLLIRKRENTGEAETPPVDGPDPAPDDAPDDAPGSPAG